MQNKHTLTALSILLQLVIPFFSYLQAETVKKTADLNVYAEPTKTSTIKGWDYLADKLIQDGLDKDTVYHIYSDPRMPAFTEVYFAIKPRESHVMYKGFRTKEKIISALNFLDSHSKTFEAAERRYFVTRYVIAAILLIETHLGKNLGKDLTLNRLSRVAAVAEPNNLFRNYRKLKKDNPNVTLSEVKTRALYLETTFYPEVRALLEQATKKNFDLFSLKGSSAGAFGLPQFLPSSYLRFGVDANKDGLVSLFEEDDAILSVANFLKSNGWVQASNNEAKKAVIWRYNHSEAYVDTVLDLANDLARLDR